jgi:hypothetical protein
MVQSLVDDEIARPQGFKKTLEVLGRAPKNELTALLGQRRAVLQELVQRRLRAINAGWERGEGWPLRNDGKVYRPNAGGQERFGRSGARFRALVGGRGSGKTGAGAQEALLRLSRGLSGAVFNPDFENFKISTWPEFRRWIPWHKVIERDRYMGLFGWEPRTAFTVHFTNGATARCKGLKDPDSARGPNINWLWYDEGARDKSGRSWLNAIAGVRIGPEPGAWVTTTPRGRRHWLYKTFVLQETPEEVQAVLDGLGYTGPLYEHFHASIHDNRANLDPMFYAAMLGSYTTGKYAQQELMGLFVQVAEGVVYADTFGPYNISLEADYTPARGPVEIAYDDGFAASPRVFLFLQVDDQGVVNVFDELYHRRHLAGTCIGEARKLLKGHLERVGFVEALAEALKTPEGPRALRRLGLRQVGDELEPLVEIAVGDPSATQLAASLRRADIPARGASGQVIEKIKNVQRLCLDADKRVWLRVHPRCKNFIREMGEDYRYPEGSEGRSGVKPLKEDDHGPDAIKDWAWLRKRKK